MPGLRPIERVRAIGGNTRNPLLMQIRASVYDRPILAAEMAEATALGAALLGGLAAGVFPNLARGARRLATETRPDARRGPEWVGYYDAHYREVYRPGLRRAAPAPPRAARAARALKLGRYAAQPSWSSSAAASRTSAASRASLRPVNSGATRS